jgi:hypothetical protein
MGCCKEVNVIEKRDNIFEWVFDSYVQYVSSSTLSEVNIENVIFMHYISVIILIKFLMYIHLVLLICLDKTLPVFIMYNPKFHQRSYKLIT